MPWKPWQLAAHCWFGKSFALWQGIRRGFAVMYRRGCGCSCWAVGTQPCPSHTGRDVPGRCGLGLRAAVCSCILQRKARMQPSPSEARQLMELLCGSPTARLLHRETCVRGQAREHVFDLGTDLCSEPH